MQNKSVSIRMDEILLRKLASIAAYEGRSMNAHVLVLIRNDIRAFEAKHGAIRLETADK